MISEMFMQDTCSEGSAGDASNEMTNSVLEYVLPGLDQGITDLPDSLRSNQASETWNLCFLFNILKLATLKSLKSDLWIKLWTACLERKPTELWALMAPTWQLF